MTWIIGFLRLLYNGTVVMSRKSDYVFILYGDNKANENEAIRKQLSAVPDNKSLILVATGMMIGEGFNLPRLDTLMLTEPISGSGRLEQYVGRLSRIYEDKNDVIVYDYVDLNFIQFERMFNKRLRTYKKIGFHVIKDIAMDKQEVNAIFDAGNYETVFGQDLVEADKEIVISSPLLNQNKINRFIQIIKSRQESGVRITVVTRNPEDNIYDNPTFIYALISQMNDAGVRVLISADEPPSFAAIDKLLVWHGSINLLGKEDASDNLIRVKDSKAAAELLELVFMEKKPVPLF